MAFAVIETGGKQYRVSPGTVLTVEQLESIPGETIRFDRVLMYQSDKDPIFGAPYADGMVVTAEVMAQVLGEKIRVFTYKPKKRQRRTMGHRQHRTQVRVLAIESAATPAAASKAQPTNEAA